MFLFFFLALIFAQFFTVSLSASNVTDQLALLHFKNQITNVDISVLANNWTANASFCNWIGVTCSSPRRQRITALNLSNMNLEGTISPLISNLSFLVSLDLRYNSFHGNIPPSIFNMSSLRLLNLSDNSLSGSFFIEDGSNSSPLDFIRLSKNKLIGKIPSNICSLRQLTKLDLSYNHLSGQIPRNIDCLSSLEKLSVKHNQISDTIPPSLGNISTLQFIVCLGNYIGGQIPPELGKSMNLQVLMFESNNLTGEIPLQIFNISSLVNIFLNNNNLSGNIPSTVGLLPNLEGIYLSGNQLEGEIPKSMTNASKLKMLELSYNLFVGIVPNNLGNLRELILLNLAGNQLRNEPTNQELAFINSLVDCQKLQFLVLSYNPLNGILPDSVKNLSRSVQLFIVRNGQVYGDIPKGIGNITSMITLDLDGNNLTGNIPSEIGYLKKLQGLRLGKNKLQGRIPVELCNLVNLGEIMLDKNNLSGPIPNCIGNLVRVQSLMLDSNRLSSSLPQGLWGIRYMLYLNVSDNLIEAELAQEIGMLDTIEVIDLSSNRFSSVIPSTLGGLENLRSLSLSNNSFVGPIPTSFGKLISLESLDLSLNNLTGVIPMSLARLSYLTKINVSYNLLEGEIPSGGIFANSSPKSFVGNKHLCGMPSLQVPICPTTRTYPHGSRSKKRTLKIVMPVFALVALVVIILSLWIIKRQKRIKLEDVEVFDIVAHKRISYYEILQGTDGFSDANILGVGSSGSVFKGILSNETIVAVKVLNLDNEEAHKRFDIECEVLKQVRHRNLVEVITTCSNDYLRAIVLPYMPNGSLESWLYKGDCIMNLLQSVEIMLDAAMAIEYLHHGYDFPIIHCDLKPSNVLLDADMVAHVSDFGISKILVENKSTAQTKTLGTIGYIAPEHGSEGMVSTAGDVYSYGIMLMEVLTRRRPTDEFFSENLSLRQWVKSAYPNSLMEVVDANLYQEEDGLNTQNNACLLSMIELSLDCSKDAPEERITMRDVVARLIKIKQRFLGTNETRS